MWHVTHETWHFLGCFSYFLKFQKWLWNQNGHILGGVIFGDFLFYFKGAFLVSFFYFLKNGFKIRMATFFLGGEGQFSDIYWFEVYFRFFILKGSFLVFFLTFWNYKQVCQTDNSLSTVVDWFVFCFNWLELGLPQVNLSYDFI